MFKDAKLPISQALVAEAYALSKMTVIKESDSLEKKAYSRAVFVEFLEVIGRAAHLMFQRTEMADLPLSEKIEHILEGLFSLVHTTVQKNEIVIEEFSDSDDDY